MQAELGGTGTFGCFPKDQVQQRGSKPLPRGRERAQGGETVRICA